MANFSAIQPKVETGALEFIAESGGCDGTGTVVAILDTGVRIMTGPTGLYDIILMPIYHDSVMTAPASRWTLSYDLVKFPNL